MKKVFYFPTLSVLLKSRKQNSQIFLFFFDLPCDLVGKFLKMTVPGPTHTLHFKFIFDRSFLILCWSPIFFSVGEIPPKLSYFGRVTKLTKVSAQRKNFHFFLSVFQKKLKYRGEIQKAAQVQFSCTFYWMKKTNFVRILWHMWMPYR